MGSEGNKINDGTSFQRTEPSLCTNGCGFFGAAATMGLCSKCYRDQHMKEEQAAMAKLVMTRPKLDSIGASTSRAVVTTAAPAVAEEETKVAAPNRCLTCRKKVGVLGFKCKCGSTFCGSHRYPVEHDCTFDYKSQGKEEIEKANPVVKADRIQRF